jgi:transposase
MCGEEAVIELVLGLVEQIAQQETRLKELEGIVKKNSSNSSKPPSGDGFEKKTKSLRTKGERKTGGQPEHPGSTLEWSSEVDVVVTHQVHECKGCGASLTEEPVQKVWARQVHDIPPIELTVTEHQAEVKNCPHCGVENQSDFPHLVENVVQYGPRLKSMMVYLMEGQLLPSARTCEILSDMVGVNVSEGTLFNTRSQCFEQLAPIAQSIQSEIVGLCTMKMFPLIIIRRSAMFVWSSLSSGASTGRFPPGCVRQDKRFLVLSALNQGRRCFVGFGAIFPHSGNKA